MRSKWVVTGVVAVAAFLFLSSGVSAQVVLYVDANADQMPHDGSSWCQAYLTLHEALAVAPFGSTIRVADGTYMPDTTGLTDPRDATFGLINGVGIEGGYAGCNDGGELRDIDAYETILSGDLNGDDGTVGNGENSYHVVSADSSITDTASTVIDGLTITGGNANGSSWATECGGGIWCYLGSPTIADCMIRDNTAAHGGGGVYCCWGSNATIADCTIRDNASNYGGGIACDESDSSITDCIISGNAAIGTIGYGGGISCGDSSTIITGCRISGNEAAEYGGGGIGCIGSASTIRDCVIVGNTASGEHSYGGGIFCSQNGSSTIQNCTISGNKAAGTLGSYGGGVATWESTPTITNCTISGNRAVGTYVSGGGLLCWDGTPTITNCILSGNEPGGIHVATTNPVVTYSCVEGGAGESWFGIGCIDADPLFAHPPDPGLDGNWDGVDDDYGNLRLAGTSPCLDVGTNTPIGGLPAADLDGNPRPVDGDGDGNAVTDMGAYEGSHQAFLLVPDPINVPEGGRAEFTVALACNPNDTIVVSVAYDSGDGDITVTSGSILMFDSANYTTPQPVTLAAAVDGDRISETTRFLVSAAGIDSRLLVARESELVYVDADAGGGNDGTSWDDAYTDLQSALDSEAAASGCWVWVAAGTYKPSLPTDPNDPRTATFQLVDGVAVYGGFSGTEDPATFDLGNRNFNGNETILSGDLNGDDGTVGNGENSYHVVSDDSSITDTASTVIDGFTITGGNANGGSWMTACGGGIWCYFGSPTIAHCTIIGNVSDAFEAVGGGIWCYGGSPLISYCTISGNTAIGPNSYGGGIDCAHASPTITDCTITGNRSVGPNSYGGGIDCNASLMTITNCVISGNTTDYMGGAIMIWGSDPILTNCTISGNQAVFIGGISQTNDSTPTVTNCILWGDEPTEIDVNLESNIPVVTYSCVEGGTGESWFGAGCVDVDPMFVRNPSPGLDGDWGTVDDDYGDLHLVCASACLDAGTNTTVPPLPSDDLDGDPRIEGGTVDMGAYEGATQAFLLVSDVVRVPEGGSAEFTVALACDPNAPVSVTVVAGSGDGDITILSGSSLTFNDANPQTVELQAAEDGDIAEGMRLVRVDGGGIATAVLTAREIENDIGPVLFVDATVPSGGDGTSWASAFDNLQDAMDTAAAFHAVDQIWVAAGTYTPTQLTELGDPRTATFQLINGVSIYGGFPNGGGDQTFDARDSKAYITILSGDLNGDDGSVGNSENSYHVVSAGSSVVDAASTVLDGFTITGGNANAHGYPKDYGGGIWCDNSSPTIAHCTITGNTSSGQYSYGGAIGAWDHCNITIVQCMITGNSAVGAISNGGGIYFGQSSNVTILGSRISGNVSDYNGGGICFWDNSTLTVTDSVISGNRSGNGGGIYGAQSTTTVTNCTFAGNAATLQGGAGLFWQVDLTLTNCTMSGNAAEFGGGIAIDDGDTTITNCIMWANGRLAILAGPTPTSPVITYSCIDGGTDQSWFGVGCIDVNPLFVRAPNPGADGLWDGVDDDYGDLRLACTSLCLDAGTNTTSPPLPAGDLAGNARVANGVVDMGAYEGGNQAMLLMPSSINVPEGGSAELAVALACEPVGAVDVTISLESGDADITIAPGIMLTFDSFNYADAQPVTLAAAQDTDLTEGTRLVRVEASGIGVAIVVAREVENDIGPIVFVDAAAAPLGNGVSWATAFTDLQDALEVASALTAVEDIWMAAGIYRPSMQPDPSNPRSATFLLASGVAIYGGLSGSEDPSTFDLANRDFGANETVLSGDLSGDDVVVTDPNGLVSEPTRAENAYHVLTAFGVDATAVLDGVTIAGGNANTTNPNDMNSSGGGFFNVFGSNPTLTRCKFTQNSALVFAGGLGNALDSHPILTDCMFVNNSAQSGGGIGNIINSSPVLVGCEFVGNTAISGGGIFNMESTSDLTLTNCAFHGNSAAEGGGLYNSASAPTLVNCEFVGNGALRDGGGMNNRDASNPTLINCTFSENVAATERGGGIYNHQASATLVNCILWGNTAAGGSQIALEREDAPCDVTVSYSAVQGGALGVHAEIGAVLNWNAGNIETDPLFVRDPDDGDDGWGDDPNTPAVDEGANDDYGDLQLRFGSPCIDSGDNTAVPPDICDIDGDDNLVERTPLDLESGLRFFDVAPIGGTGVADPPDYPAIVDMGAYEFPRLGDCDTDGDVDMDDYTIFAACMTGPNITTVPPGCTQEQFDLADADHDGDVDMVDFAFFQSAFGG